MSRERFREKITVQKLKADATTSALGPTQSHVESNWETHHQPYAKVIGKGGKEFERYGRIREETTHVIRVRRSTETEAITPEMRVQFDGKTYYITAAYLPQTGSREIQIEAIQK